MAHYKFLPISQVIENLKGVIQEQYPSVFAVGEVSNFMRASSGHYYFTLSDAQASLSIVLFKQHAFNLPMIQTLKNGDQVYCAGVFSIYPRRGSLQLNAHYLHSDGLGLLKVKYDVLKKQLASEGLFDQSRKKAVPLFPQKMALITSAAGAAVHDFLHVYKKRSLAMDVIIIPSLVQGEGAAKSLVRALKKAQSIPEIDMIVFTRGGGSFEDLFSFNDEILVREIAKCDIPVLSAIGHQVDFTLCDYVSDQRAQTPTEAAQILSAPAVALKEKMQRMHQSLKYNADKLSLYIKNLLLKSRPDVLLYCLNNILEKNTIKHQRLGEKFSRKMDNYFQNLKHEMEKKSIKLNALDPHKIWERGVVILEDSKGKVISSFENYTLLAKNEKLYLKFKSGIGIAEKIS